MIYFGIVEKILSSRFYVEYVFYIQTDKDKFMFSELNKFGIRISEFGII